MYRLEQGDVFDHIDDYEGVTIIPHVVNNIGVFGAGFAKALADRWPQVRYDYRMWHFTQAPKIGDIEVSKPVPNKRVYVVHMMAQSGIGRRPDGTPPIDYPGLETCMTKVRDALAVKPRPTHPRIVGPMFGAGLAGGQWSKIETMIQTIWSDLDVTIYQLGQQDA